MRDVWIYAASRQRTDGVRAGLAELGFTARYLGNGEPLGPAMSDGADLGRPALAVVVFGPRASPRLRPRRPAS
jgi:hypothetical protein